MANKTGLTFVVFFAFLLIVGMASALTVGSSVTFSDYEFQEKISVSNPNSSVNYTFNSISFSMEAPQGIFTSFIIEGLTLNGTSNNDLIVKNTTSLDYSALDLGDSYSQIINLTGTKYSLNETDNSTLTESFNRPVTIILERNNYCKIGNKGTFIKITDVEDNDDFEWTPLQDVEIEVEVKNNHNSDRKKVIVKLALYDLTEQEYVEFANGDDELEESVRIPDDDDEVLTFNFKLPADIDPDKDYRLYIKAYESGEEDTQCNSYVEEDIEIDSDYEVLLDRLELPQVFSCGSQNIISFRVYNLDLFDEEEMRINLYSNEMVLDINSERFELDRGDYEEITMSFTIPEGKEAKSYRFTLYAEYDYSESLDRFTDSESLGTYSIRVEGDKCQPKAVPSISPVLQEDTETKVGRDLVVQLTITNPSDNEAADFIIALDEYTSWASSATVDQSTFRLAAGESRTITATFNPTKAGSQEFLVKAIYGTRVQEQRVTVSIDESSSWFSRMSNSLKIEGNTTFWLTIGIFIVLILIIVVLLLKFINSARNE